MINFQNTNFKDKKVVMRVDFNVPLNAEFQVTDDTRISSAVSTIKKILADGGSVVSDESSGKTQRWT
jgi:phosphoglycerate kinase